MRALVLWLFALPLLVNGQNIIDNRTANVLPLWKKGDRFTYQVKKTEQKIKNAVVSESGEVHYKVTYTVLDTVGGQFLMEQRLSDFKLVASKKDAEMSQEERAIADRMLSMFEDVPMKYSCTLDGTELTLVNVDEVLQMTRSALETLSSSFPDEENKAAFNSLIDAILTPEAMSTSALENAENLHTLFGGGYVVGERLKQDVELPNLLGGDPLPGKLELVMNTLDQRTGLGTFMMTLQVDGAKLAAMATDMVKKMADALEVQGEMSPADKRELDEVFRSMRINDTVKTTVDLNVAIVTVLSYKREVTMKGHRNVESTEYKLIR